MNEANFFYDSLPRVRSWRNIFLHCLCPSSSLANKGSTELCSLSIPTIVRKRNSIFQLRKQLWRRKEAEVGAKLALLGVSSVWREITWPGKRLPITVRHFLFLPTNRLSCRKELKNILRPISWAGGRKLSLWKIMNRGHNREEQHGKYLFIWRTTSKRQKKEYPWRHEHLWWKRQRREIFSATK